MLSSSLPRLQQCYNGNILQFRMVAVVCGNTLCSLVKTEANITLIEPLPEKLNFLDLPSDYFDPLIIIVLPETEKKN